MGRRGYRLNLRGAEIEWVDRPADALSIERVIHRQRALQQATRMARVGESRLAFGRTLKPAYPLRPGMLLGYSSDTDATRDPDQPHASLRMMTSESFDLETLRTLVGDTSDNVAGVPGIGKKGAIELVTQFGGLDGLLARTGELKAERFTLQEFESLLRLARDLLADLLERVSGMAPPD